MTHIPQVYYLFPQLLRLHLIYVIYFHYKRNQLSSQEAISLTGCSFHSPLDQFIEVPPNLGVFFDLPLYLWRHGLSLFIADSIIHACPRIHNQCAQLQFHTDSFFFLPSLDRYVHDDMITLIPILLWFSDIILYLQDLKPIVFSNLARNPVDFLDAVTDTTHSGYVIQFFCRRLKIHVIALALQLSANALRCLHTFFHEAHEAVSGLDNVESVEFSEIPQDLLPRQAVHFLKVGILPFFSNLLYFIICLPFTYVSIYLIPQTLICFVKVEESTVPEFHCNK